MIKLRSYFSKNARKKFKMHQKEKKPFSLKCVSLIPEIFPKFVNLSNKNVRYPCILKIYIQIQKIEES